MRLALGVGGGALFAVAAALYCMGWLSRRRLGEAGASLASVLLNARGHVRRKVIAGEYAERLLAAESVEEVGELLDGCAAECGLLELCIVRVAPHFHDPALRRITPVSDRPFRVDYPIVWAYAGTSYEVVLRLVSERPAEYRHAGVERIVARLGDALEAWVRANPAAFEPGRSGGPAARRVLAFTPRGQRVV